MASKYNKSLKDSVLNASDLIHDFFCSLCKDDNLNTEAEYFCGDCSKYYCDKCLTFHAKVLKQHVVLGRKDVNKWIEQGDALVTCDIHPPKVLELLCDDHAELCCHLCVSLNHRMCRSITLISDLAKGIHELADFKKLPVSASEVTASLNQVIEARKKNQNSLKDSRKTMLTKIKTMRTSLNQLLDELEKMTVEEMDSVLAELERTLQKDIDACIQIQDQLNAFLDIMQAKDENSESISYIGYRKCQDKMTDVNRLLQETLIKPEVTVIFQPHTRAEQLLSDLKTLGNIQECAKTHNLSDMSSSGKDDQLGLSKVFKMKGKKTFTAKLNSDTKHCNIAGITELPGGEIVLVDSENRKAKVLDSKYNAIANCNLPKIPWDICSI